MSGKGFQRVSCVLREGTEAELCVENGVRGKLCVEKGDRRRIVF